LIAATFAIALSVTGCSGKSASAPQPAPSNVTVLGTSGAASQTPKVSPTDPVAVEGLPASLGVQATPIKGDTAITQVQAIDIASKRKPAGAKTVTALHVLFSSAKTRAQNPPADKPIDAWMVTFHGATSPSPSAASPGMLGRYTMFIDSKTGKILQATAYTPNPQ
jgi:hypothetical protein